MLNTNLARSAWSPAENNYNHYVKIDLGARKKIKKIATLGRPRSEECVTEFVLEYSDDGELWKSVADTNSESQVVY
jgi:contactin associated protein-like 2